MSMMMMFRITARARLRSIWTNVGIDVTFYLSEPHEPNEAKYDQAVKLSKECKHHDQKVEDVTHALVW